MNFFKSSVFSDFKLPDVLAFSEKDDPETSISSDSGDFSSDSQHAADHGSEPPSDSGSASDAGVSKQEEENTGLWGFGGLMKSITSKSEGLLQAYRKDLEEFGSGLKKESQILAEVAAHAVKDLPTSLETSAHIAQESIESVGQVVEDFSSSVLRGIAELGAQGKDAVLRMDDDEGSAVTATGSSSRYDNVVVGKYSRFEAQVRAMQHDSSTYCEEPADMIDYAAWESTFNLSDKREDIDSLVTENTFFQELLSRFVPEVVSEDIFWTRYFYHLHKIQQTEEARADLVKRAIALDEEDLTWDTEEEADEGATVQEQSSRDNSGNPQEEVIQHFPVELSPVDLRDQPGKDEVFQEPVCTSPKDDLGSKDLGRTILEDEDELGWEVAEDAESSSNDGKRSSNSETSWEVPEVPREDIRKRLAAQEQDEEDLSWDVDDGDNGSK